LGKADIPLETRVRASQFLDRRKNYEPRIPNIEKLNNLKMSTSSSGS